MADIYSAISTVASATVTFTDWWLKDPTTPALNSSIDVQEPLRLEKFETQAVFRPLGRTLPVVVSGTLNGEQGTLDMDFTTKAAFDAFDALRNTQRVLLLQSPFGDNLYVRLGATRDASLKHADSTSQYRDVSIGFVQVDKP